MRSFRKLYNLILGAGGMPTIRFFDTNWSMRISELSDNNPGIRFLMNHSINPDCETWFILVQKTISIRRQMELEWKIFLTSMHEKFQLLWCLLLDHESIRETFSRFINCTNCSQTVISVRARLGNTNASSTNPHPITNQSDKLLIHYRLPYLHHNLRRNFLHWIFSAPNFSLDWICACVFID